MSRVVESLRELSAWRRSHALQGKSVGFVPTMGALHAGHRSLLERSRAENDLSVLSIYVNPTQFDNSGDLDNYPRTLQADVRLASEAGVDVVFSPSYAEMYPDGYRYKVSESEESRILCGAHRPGHFDGVLTIVLKLLNLVAPTRAYFGEKDYQQLALVQGMARAFFLPVEIIGAPTVREADGLALSSRNARLSTEERARAAAFPETLRAAETAEEAAARLRLLGFAVDYVEDRGGRRFGAAHLGEVRLIDNLLIQGGGP